MGGGVRLGRAVQDRGAATRLRELLERLRDREPGGEHGADEFLALPGGELGELLGDGLGPPSSSSSSRVPVIIQVASSGVASGGRRSGRRASRTTGR
jgi:hypothetical protein